MKKDGRTSNCIDLDWGKWKGVNNVHIITHNCSTNRAQQKHTQNQANAQQVQEQPEKPAIWCTFQEKQNMLLSVSKRKFSETCC